MEFPFFSLSRSTHLLPREAARRRDRNREYMNLFALLMYTVYFPIRNPAQAKP